LNVVVVNEFLTKRHFPGRSAGGKRVRFGDNEDRYEKSVVDDCGSGADIRERGCCLPAGIGDYALAAFRIW